MLNDSTHVLKVENLTKIFSFGGSWWRGKSPTTFTAVDSISFDLRRGEILGVLGPNGAGKTTTIQMLLSTLIPTSGKISYFGKDFFSNRSECLQHLAFASTYVRLPGRLTILENLDVYGRLYGLTSVERKDRIEKLLKQFEMWDYRYKESGALSAGQITRVMLVKAFLSRPKIVLLDEPTASLDPDIAFEVRQYILKEQQEHGTTFLLTSHNMDEVTQVCNRVMVLQKGKIIASDKPENLARSVSTGHLSLMVPEGMDKAAAYVQGRAWKFDVQEKWITIEVEESQVAQVLTEFAQHGISYSHISIEKPTLEDYFMQVARSQRKPRKS